MAKSGRGKGGTSAPLSLLGRYKEQLGELRARYVADVRDQATRLMRTGGDLAEAARLEAKARRRESETNYQIMQREFRRDLAKARKAGLFKGKAPSLVPTRGVSENQITRRVGQLLDEIADVLTGNKRTQRLNPEQIAAVKKRYAPQPGQRAMPPQIIGDRIILDKNAKVTKAGVIEHVIPGFTQQRVVYLDDRGDADDAITKLFASMSDKQVVVILIGDNHSLYFDRDQEDEFRETMFAYQATGAVYVTLGVFADRRHADAELNARATAVRAASRARVKAARAARKAAEKAERKARTGPLGEYLHSGKQGPAKATIREAKEAARKARLAERAAKGKAPFPPPRRSQAATPRKPKKPLSNRKRGR